MKALLVCIPIGGLLAHLPAPALANDARIIARCPMQGDAKEARVKALNQLKRRLAIPTARDIDPKVTIAALVAPGDDTGRWDEHHAATIEAYVADVKVGGVESVNCHTHDAAYRDTHIELTLEPNKHDESTYVIVEVTPQVRAEMLDKGIDWSTPALRRTLTGRWVRVTGWLLFDEEHKPNARNTASGRAHIWRATVWELHPVTALEVLPGKPPSAGPT